MRESRPWWWAFPCGAAVLVAYGFIPTAQPTADFGRIYAVYGGFFILLSYAWGWAIDGVRPDLGGHSLPNVPQPELTAHSIVAHSPELENACDMGLHFENYTLEQ